MYQIVMVLCGEEISGAKYNDIKTIEKEIQHLQEVAEKNNFPAKYTYKEI